MSACMKGLRIFAVTLLSISLAACTQTTGSVNTRGGKVIHTQKQLTKAERRRIAEQQQAIATAIILGAVVLGAAASSGGRHYGGNQRYYRHRGGGCVNYGTPNPYSGMC